MITISIDPRQIEAAIEGYDAYAHQAWTAMRRAVNKTGRWVASQGAREISKAHDVPLKALRSRRRVATRLARGAMDSAHVFFGTLPIAASYLGKPKQTATGAIVGKYQFDGAFVAKMPSGHVGIFKRKGHARLPIEEQRVLLSGAPAAIQRIAALGPERLRTTFLQELRYETLVRGRR